MGSFDRTPEGYDGPAFPHVINCNSKWNGADRHQHENVAEVRECFQAAADEKRGIRVWPCSWLLEGRYDDGSVFTYECRAPTRYTDERDSYACTRGHDHTPAEVRVEQGWDYAEDAQEAAQLARAGVRPVPMSAEADTDSWIWR
jgi:hypothetical protein